MARPLVVYFKDVLYFNHARRVYIDAARTLQERFGACVATYDAAGNPTEATEEAQEFIHPAAQALWEALDAFAIPAREEVAP